MNSHPENQLVDLGDVTVPVVLRGSGPAILPVPGGAVGYGAFPDIVELLETAGTVILHDRVGTGRTPFRDGGPDDLAKQAEDLRRVIETVGHGPAVVLAHSMGGPAAVQLALDHPDVVAGLVLLDISPFNDAKRMEGMSRYQRMPRLLESPLITRAYKAASRRMLKAKLGSRPRTPALELAIDEMLDVAHLRRLAAFWAGMAPQAALLHKRLQAQPLTVGGVTVSAGRRSGNAIRLAHKEIAALTGTEFASWAGTSHALHLERPRQVADTVVQVLRAARTSPT